MASNTELYLPYHAADDQGILDPELVSPVPISRASELLLEGRMPNKAGLVDLPNALGAFDLVDIEYLTPKEIVVRPVEKNRVDSDGQIQRPGDVTFALPYAIRPYARALGTGQVNWERPVYEGAACYTHRFNSPDDAVERPDIEVVRYSFGKYPIFRPIRIELDGTVIARS